LEHCAFALRSTQVFHNLFEHEEGLSFANVCREGIPYFISKSVKAKGGCQDTLHNSFVMKVAIERYQGIEMNAWKEASYCKLHRQGCAFFEWRG
jgi:hypothetical protein